MATRNSRRERRSEKQRQRWGQIAIGVFLVLLMVLSIAQVSIDQNDGTTTAFGKTKFTRTADGFTAKVAGETRSYDFVPYEESNGTVFFESLQGAVVDVRPAPGAGKLLSDASFIAITFDPGAPAETASLMDLVRLELTRDFGNVFSGVLENSTLYPALQRVDCPSATPQVPVIKLLVANTTSTGFANATLDGSCLTIIADAPSIVAVKDYLRLAKNGVMSDG